MNFFYFLANQSVIKYYGTYKYQIQNAKLRRIVENIKNNLHYLQKHIFFNSGNLPHRLKGYKNILEPI